jgi:hypothetical protein
MNTAANDEERLLLLSMYEWFGDCRAHERMCNELARTLRVPYIVVDYVYETRLKLICPSLTSFPNLDAYIAATRDALLRELRAYEYEEAHQSWHDETELLRAFRLAEVERQQKKRRERLIIMSNVKAVVVVVAAARRSRRRRRGVFC